MRFRVPSRSSLRVPKSYQFSSHPLADCRDISPPARDHSCNQFSLAHSSEIFCGTYMAMTSKHTLVMGGSRFEGGQLIRCGAHTRDTEDLVHLAVFAILGSYCDF